MLLGCKSVDSIPLKLAEILKDEVLERTEKQMIELSVTVIFFKVEQSAGTIHDFYSEGDYWWPDPRKSEGAYIRCDGETNLDNFVEHRHVMIRFCWIVGDLISIWSLTGNKAYVVPVLIHVLAWLMDEKALMSPHLLYAQMVKNVSTGRVNGIIDTIHLIKMVLSLIRLEEKGLFPCEVQEGTKQWFTKYLKLMTIHPYGVDEMGATNNHETCKVMQATIFAQYAGNKNVMEMRSARCKSVFLLRQMEEDGSSLEGLKRTTPYGYSLFSLDTMSTLCQILSTDSDNLWEYTTPDGKDIRQVLRLIDSYVADKSS